MKKKSAILPYTDFLKNPHSSYVENDNGWGNLYDFSNSHNKVKSPGGQDKEPLLDSYSFNKGQSGATKDKNILSPFLHNLDYKERDPETESQYPHMDESKRVEGLPPRSSSIAQNIVAEWLLNTDPVYIDLNAKSRVAMTVGDLFDATSDFSIKNRARCTTKLTRVDRVNDRFTFRVKCSEKKSEKNGHVVKVKVKRAGKRLKIKDMDILVSCTCPFYKFYGSKHNSTQNGYDEKSTKYNGKAPNINDPKRENLICKHIASIKPLLENYVLITKKQKTKKYRR